MSMDQELRQLYSQPKSEDKSSWNWKYSKEISNIKWLLKNITVKTFANCQAEIYYFGTQNIIVVEQICIVKSCLFYVDEIKALIH